MKYPKIPALAAAVLLAVLLTVSCGAEHPRTDGQVVLDVLAGRTSIRSYRDTPVGADTVELLLRAAMAAPSANNSQSWAFVVVDDPGLLQRLADSLPYAKMAAQAPMAVVVCGVQPPEKQNNWWMLDASAAAENLLIAAHAVGLGAVWTGVYPRADRVDAVRGVLQLPADVIPLNLIPVGYPAVKPEPKRKWDPAKVHRNGWSE